MSANYGLVHTVGVLPFVMALAGFQAAGPVLRSLHNLLFSHELELFSVLGYLYTKVPRRRRLTAELLVVIQSYLHHNVKSSRHLFEVCYTKKCKEYLTLAWRCFDEKKGRNE